MIALRPVRFPADEQALLRLDTSVVTDRIYRVASTPASFTLIEEPIFPTLHKSFDLTGELGDERLWHAGYVAQHDDEVVGFAAVRAVTAEGLMEGDLDEAQLKQHMVQISDVTVGIVDASRFGRAAFSVFALPHELDRVSTNAAALPAVVEALRTQDVAVDLV